MKYAVIIFCGLFFASFLTWGWIERPYQKAKRMILTLKENQMAELPSFLKEAVESSFSLPAPSTLSEEKAMSKAVEPKWAQWPIEAKEQIETTGFHTRAVVLHAQLVHLKEWLPTEINFDPTKAEDFQLRYQEFCNLVKETAKENGATLEFHQGHRFTLFWYDLPDQSINFHENLTRVQLTVQTIEEAFESLEVGKIAIGIDSGRISFSRLSDTPDETDWNIVGEAIETAELVSHFAFDLDAKTVITERAAEQLSAAFELERLSSSDEWTPALFAPLEAIDLSTESDTPQPSPEDSTEDFSEQRAA